MPAYVVAHFTIDDEQAYRRYAEAFARVIAPYNGEVLAADDNKPILEGEAPQGRTVILRFPDMETATAWWKSPEYQEIAEHRRAGTSPYLITIVEGRTGA